MRPSQINFSFKKGLQYPLLRSFTYCIIPSHSRPTCCLPFRNFYGKPTLESLFDPLILCKTESMDWGEMLHLRRYLLITRFTALAIYLPWKAFFSPICGRPTSLLSKKRILFVFFIEGVKKNLLPPFKHLRVYTRSFYFKKKVSWKVTG